jgi:ubiquinone/menaquinone biosynthesis C-methylase UbiE
MILRREGWNIIGLDLSKNLLNIAKQKMRKERVEFSLIRSDMRHLPFRNQTFEGVVCMFTSFGYLPSEAEDVKSLKDMWRIETI